jgi:hypothetical protein
MAFTWQLLGDLGQRRAGDATRDGAQPDEGEEPRALFFGPEVRLERPELRDDHDAERRDPNKEHVPGGHARISKEHGERPDAAEEDEVRADDELLAVDPRSDLAVAVGEDAGEDRRRNERLRLVVDADQLLEHLPAYRLDDVVGGDREKDPQRRHEHRDELVPPNVDDEREGLDLVVVSPGGRTRGIGGRARSHVSSNGTEGDSTSARLGQPSVRKVDGFEDPREPNGAIDQRAARSARSRPGRQVDRRAAV